MNLIQFVILVIVFAIALYALFKNKKKMDGENKYFFKSGLLVWMIILFVIIVNSGIFSPKLPKELGGGAEYQQQMEESVDAKTPPKLKNKNKINYKKEGEKALEKALK